MPTALPPIAEATGPSRGNAAGLDRLFRAGRFGRISAALLVAFLASAHCGCSSTARSTPPDASAVDPRKAYLALDEILPSPEFPAPAVQPTANASPASERHLRTGRRHFEDRLWTDAIASLEKAATEDPCLLEARCLIAQAAVRQGNTKLAEAHLREALACHPRDVAVHQMLGELAWQSGRVPEAISELRLALRADNAAADRPETVLAHLTLAHALRRSGYLKAAASEYESYQAATKSPSPAMKAHPELGDALVLQRGKVNADIGDIRMELGDPAGAAAAYRRAIESEPDNADLQRSLALMLARDRRFDEAMVVVRQLIEKSTAEGLIALREVCATSGNDNCFSDEVRQLIRNAGKAEVILALADALGTEGRNADAIDGLERAVSLEPKRIDLRLRLARLYRQSGNSDRFVNQLVEITGAFPESEKTIRELISDQTDDAATRAELDSARRFVAGHPQNGHARLVRGRLLAASKHLEEAAVELNSARQLLPDSASVHGAYALVLVELNRWDDAIEAASSAVERGLNSAELQLALGRANDAMEQFEAAEEAYLDSFRQDRDSSTSLRMLAEMLERGENVRKAEQLYRRVVDEVDPRDMSAREALIRMLLNGNEYKQATEYFDDFARLEQTGAAVERCRALIQLTSGAGASGEERLNAYRESLRATIRQYPSDNATRIYLSMSYLAFADYKSAMGVTDEVLALDPRDLRGRELKARILGLLLEYEEAERIVAGLLSERPRTRLWTETLVELRLNMAEFDKAIEPLRALLDRKDLESHHLRYMRDLIPTLLSAGRMDEAVRVSQEWLDSAPDDAGRRALHLAVLSRAGRHDEAIQMAGNWLEASPQDDRLRGLLVSRLEGAKQWIAAKQHILKWLADKPDDILLNQMLIMLFWGTSDWDSAVELAETGLELGDQTGSYRRWLGQTYILAGRYDEAVELFDSTARNLEAQIEKASGRDARRMHAIQAIDSYVDSILAMVQDERYADAEEAANRLLGPQANRPMAEATSDLRLVIRLKNVLANIYQETDRISQAVAQLADVVNMSPDAEHHNNLGYTLADAGRDLDEAERLIRRAITEVPRNDAYLDSLGWVYYKRGRFEDAVKWLRRSTRQTETQDPVIQDHLGDALYRLGRRAEAESAWKTAASLTDRGEAPGLSPERRRLHSSVQEKLSALASGGRVNTARLAKPQPTTTTAPAGPRSN